MMNLDALRLKSRSKQWVGYFVSPNKKSEGRIYMLLTILQTLFNFILKLGAIFGLAFMIACTVFVIVCVVHGDIRINIIRNESEKRE